MADDLWYNRQDILDLFDGITRAKETNGVTDFWHVLIHEFFPMGEDYWVDHALPYISTPAEETLRCMPKATPDPSPAEDKEVTMFTPIRIRHFLKDDDGFWLPKPTNDVPQRQRRSPVLTSDTGLQRPRRPGLETRSSQLSVPQARGESRMSIASRAGSILPMMPTKKELIHSKMRALWVNSIASLKTKFSVSRLKIFIKAVLDPVSFSKDSDYEKDFPAFQAPASVEFLAIVCRTVRGRNAEFDGAEWYLGVQQLEKFFSREDKMMEAVPGDFGALAPRTFGVVAVGRFVQFYEWDMEQQKCFKLGGFEERCHVMCHRQKVERGFRIIAAHFTEQCDDARQEDVDGTVQ